VLATTFPRLSASRLPFIEPVCEFDVHRRDVVVVRPAHGVSVV